MVSLSDSGPTVSPVSVVDPRIASVDNEGDPQTWTTKALRAYKEKHGRHPDGVEFPKVALPGPVSEAAQKLLDPGSVFGSAADFSGRVLDDQLQFTKSIERDRQRQQEVNARLIEAAEIQAAERAEDRALLKNQTEYARQARNTGYWAVGMSALAAIAASASVVLMLTVG